MPDWTTLPLSPTHLSVFLLDRTTGGPHTRLPVYAEIAWTEHRQPPPPDDRFEEMVGRALANVDTACDQSSACHAKVTRAFASAVTRAWPDEVRDQLRAGSAANVIEMAVEVLRRALQALQTPSFTSVETERLVDELDRQMREYADQHNLEVNAPFDSEGIRSTYPLGVLATDHAGYASYDMTRLPAPVRESVISAAKALRSDPAAVVEAAIWLYPLSAGFEHYEVLKQRRFTADAIIARLEFTPTVAFPRPCDLGLPSLQNPSLTDWRLSPASFASNPAALVGDDGCETLLPANLALQEYHFYQVVRLLDAAVPAPPVPAGASIGVVHDYRLAWYALGHSLGQIQYSLPLAPAESVNLAVIDWTRFDEAKRAETSKLNEQIVHDQRRDRTITETVSAAIKEYQEGSSFMAGVASSVGASGNIGAFGVAAGLAGALGGTTSDSSGSRDLSATTVQQLSERISQASSAMREFQSTVVVQSAQSEKEAIETRTIVNYNHSHALTILYYEVLRHFRIVTEFVRFRPAVLVKMKTDWFPPENVDLTIQTHRTSLEAALLDLAHKDGFDAASRVAQRVKLSGAGQAAPDVGAKEFNYFTFYIKTGEQFSEDRDFVNIHATLLGPGFTPTPLLGADPGPPDVNINPPGSFRHKNLTNTFTALFDPWVRWRQIDAIKLEVHLEGDESTASFKSVKVVAYDTWGGTETLVDVTYDDEIVMTQTTYMYVPIKRAPAAPGSPALSAEEAADSMRRTALIDHLLAHKAHYSRAIVLGQDPLERAKTLEDAGVLAYVENRPLDVVGDWVAYPCTQTAWAKAIMARVADETFVPPLDERLVTLPARGVFAEARLGHCNASEEIDNTRFWDWQQSPIPHYAPEIAPVQAVTPQPQQQNLAPTPFPQSLVNIVNPPNAPDPTGMAAALTALAAPNIFRDMSGRAETSDLLKRLSDNSIKIAEASSKARQILSNQAGSNASSGGGYGGATGTGGTTGSGRAGTGMSSGGSMPPAEQLDRMQVVRSAVRNNELTPEEGRQEVKKIVQDQGGAGGGVRLSLDDNDAYVRAFFPPKNNSGESYLVGRIEGGDANEVTAYHLEVGEGENSGSVEWKGGGGLMTKLFAKRPGVCGIHAKVLSGRVAQGREAGAVISVPLFAHISSTAADLQAVFGSWNIASHADEVLRRAEMYAWSIFEGVNLRFIWSLEGFINWQVPAQFSAGGFAENFLTHVVLANTSPTNQFVEVQTTGAANVPAFNGSVTLNLGQLSTDPVVGPTVTGLAGALAIATPPAGIETFAVEYFARLISSVAARAVCLAVLGPKSAGAAPTLAEYTGYELAQNGDASDPAAYTDVGREAMQLRGATISMLSELLPVPPNFK